jgi:L-lactate dehydrogenase
MTEETSRSDHKTKLSIIGAGRVGSTLAFASMIENVSDEVVLIDKNSRLAEGEAMDIFHGLPFIPPAMIRSGGFEECSDSDIIVISAGMPRKTGQSRLDLIKMNLEVATDIIQSISTIKDGAVITVLTNPVDIITKAVQRLSGLSPERVIGTGTLLDTSRLRSILSTHFKVDAGNIYADVLGEHGDSHVIAWSSSRISCSSLEHYSVSNGIRWDDPTREGIESRVRRAGADIIERKGSSFYAVAIAMTRVLKSIMKDEMREFTLSTVLDGEEGFEDVALSLPCLTGRRGRINILPLDLSEKERHDLQLSAQILKDAFKHTGI